MKKKRIMPPTYFMTSILLIVVAHFILPIFIFIHLPFNFIGLILIVMGGVLNLIADKNFKRLKTTVKPFEYSSTLVTNSVFSISRNPMYLGMFLFLLGKSILFGSFSPFLISITFMLLINYVFIRPEENMLLEVFDEDYIAYKNKVRRWI